MPRKRKPVRNKKNKTNSKRKIIAYLLLLAVLVAGLVALRVIFQPSQWQPGDRFVVLKENSDKSALFVIYEPQSQSIYRMRIPADTQLSSAHNLGKWRLGSLWQLYRNEGLSGGMAADSFALSMGLPVDSWEGDLGFKDRLKIVFFELQVAKSQYVDIDPLRFGLIREVKLVDGDTGFIANDKASGSIARLFASENVLKERARVGLKNYSLKFGKIENISNTVEVLGTKIVTIDNLDEKDMDCEIKYGLQAQLTAQKLGNIFSCNLQKSNDLGSLDISMEVGSKFWARF